jgi:hypothetical protein|tara:strand:- start:151 stop:372 length:222 start_codon:yes stop_codon:yes gene_type:complete
MVKITKDKGVNKDGFPTGGVEVSDSPSKVGIDPRSEIQTNEYRVYNKIDKGTTVEVRGRRAMLKDKKKTATWF